MLKTICPQNLAQKYFSREKKKLGFFDFGKQKTGISILRFFRKFSKILRFWDFFKKFQKIWYFQILGFFQKISKFWDLRFFHKKKIKIFRFWNFIFFSSISQNILKFSLLSMFHNFKIFYTKKLKNTGNM